MVTFSPRARDQPALVMIDKAHQAAVAGHVRLIAISVPVRPGFGPDLDAGIGGGAQFEIAGQFEVGRLPAFPDQVIACGARFFGRALGGQRAVLDRPPTGGALPTGQILAVEQADARGGCERGGLGRSIGRRQRAGNPTDQGQRGSRQRSTPQKPPARGHTLGEIGHDPSSTEMASPVFHVFPWTDEL